jgi:hypothetical protein
MRIMSKNKKEDCMKTNKVLNLWLNWQLVWIPIILTFVWLALWAGLLATIPVDNEIVYWLGASIGTVYLWYRFFKW